MEYDSFTEFTFEGFKNASSINCDSELLLNYILWLEWDSKVKSYFQPLMEIKAQTNTNEFEAKIDLWVDFHNGITWLIHFIDAETAQRYSEQPSLYAGVNHSCHLNKMRYVAIVGSEAISDMLKFNLNLLWFYAKDEIRLAHLLLVNKFFSRQRIPTVGKLKNTLLNNGFDASLVYTFIFHKIVLANIEQLSITDENVILNGHSQITVEHIINTAEDRLFNNRYETF